MAAGRRAMTERWQRDPALLVRGAAVRHTSRCGVCWRGGQTAWPPTGRWLRRCDRPVVPRPSRPMTMRVSAVSVTRGTGPMPWRPCGGGRSACWSTQGEWRSPGVRGERSDRTRRTPGWRGHATRVILRCQGVSRVLARRVSQVTVGGQGHALASHRRTFVHALGSARVRRGSAARPVLTGSNVCSRA
jgi:hypothetical protein